MGALLDDDDDRTRQIRGLLHDIDVVTSYDTSYQCSHGEDWIAICLLQLQRPTFTWKSSGKSRHLSQRKEFRYASLLFELNADALQPRDVY